MNQFFCNLWGNILMEHHSAAAMLHAPFSLCCFTTYCISFSFFSFLFFSLLVFVICCYKKNNCSEISQNTKTKHFNWLCFWLQSRAVTVLLSISLLCITSHWSYFLWHLWRKAYGTPPLVFKCSFIYPVIIALSLGCDLEQSDWSRRGMTSWESGINVGQVVVVWLPGDGRDCIRNLWPLGWLVNNEEELRMFHPCCC